MSDDWVATLADALWPHLRARVASEGLFLEWPQKQKVMNRRQAATYLGMTPNGLRKRRHLLLQPRRLPGYSRPLYFRCDLDAWLALGLQREKER